MKVGVFDSGVGGLSLAHALCERVPNIDLCYFGDTLHMPYGEKSSVAIMAYAQRIALWMVDQGCGAIVVACNSASSIASQALSSILPSHIQLFNVIDPVVAYVGSRFSNHHVGILATQSTIDSQAYPKRIQTLNAAISCRSIVAPMLAAAIENQNQSIIDELLTLYLSQAQDLDALVLACTHYPLIKDAIIAHVPNTVEVIDGTQNVVDVVAPRVSDGGSGQRAFFVSDMTQSFAQRAAYFFGETIHLQACSLS